LPKGRAYKEGQLAEKNKQVNKWKDRHFSFLMTFCKIAEKVGDFNGR
jgi:hypothetical protein